MKQLGAILSAVAVALTMSASASARGGSGTVTTFGVGPLSLELSTSDDVFNWAGRADRVYYLDQYGSTVRLSSGTAAFAVMEYDYSAGGYTDYSLYWDGSSWIFGEFDTTIQRFHTERGTRVGMSYAEARRRENRPLGGAASTKVSGGFTTAPTARSTRRSCATAVVSASTPCTPSARIRCRADQRMTHRGRAVRMHG